MGRPLLVLFVAAVVATPGIGAARAPAGGRRALTRPVKKGSLAWKRRHRAPPRTARLRSRPGRAAPTAITLRNLHTGEVLAVLAGQAPAPELVNRLLRCRWTGRSTSMDPRLVPWVLEAAARFGATEIQVISAYRHSKFNEVLRKKGREVARRSNHRLGRAIDFRLVGVDVAQLFDYLKRRRLGGIGRYPDSQFVHLDTQRFRTWGGR